MVTNKGGKFLKKHQEDLWVYIKFELNKTKNVVLDYYMVSYDNSSYVFLRTFS